MDKLQAVKFDVRGTRVENRVLREKVPIKDKECPWIVPNGTPFFAEEKLVTVYNAAGGILKLGTDYWFEGKFLPFCEITGRDISSFIQLSEKVRNENAFVSVTYQSIGAWFVPRNSIDDWLRQMYNGKLPIPWSKVFNVPPTLPASMHSHSIKTEIGDWYELTFFFNYIANYYSTRDPGVQSGADKVIDESFAQLKAVKATQLKRLVDHDKNYGNAHRITKAHLDLGNLDNNPTATLDEELAGVASNRFSTPGGVLALSEDYGRDSDLVMRNGVLPFSYYGGGSYIPPQISGSFEGMGSLVPCSAMCMERNGIFMMLTNHNDGRNEGLYYSQMPGFHTSNARITYTGYKYQPPSLQAIGFNPTVVVAGSNHRIMMVGNPGLARCFLTLTNGTLDGSVHSYYELDMSAVAGKMTSAYRADVNRFSIHVIGEYAVLVVSVSGTRNDNYMFFRIPLSDLKGPKKKLKFEHVPVTFKDYEGQQFTNADAFAPFKATASPSGGYSKYGPFTFRQPATNIYKVGRGLVLSCAKPGVLDSGYMFISGLVQCERSVSGQPLIRTQPKTGLNLEFNPKTGVITMVFNPPTLDIGFTDNTLAERNNYASAFFNPFYYGMGTTGAGSWVILETGEIAIATINGGNIFPAFVYKIKIRGRTSAADVLSQPMDGTSGVYEYLRMSNQVVNSPLLSGTAAGSMTYEDDGELYSAVDQLTNNRKTYFRKVTGPYAVRPEVTNLSVENVMSRPLSNAIYTSNLKATEVPICISGSDAELKAAGTEMGTTAFSAMGYTGITGGRFPQLAEFAAPSVNNVVTSCPRTFGKTFDEPNKTVTYKALSFYGARKPVMDKFLALIPSEYTDPAPWSISLYLMQDAAGGTFKGLNLGIAILAFHDPVRGFARQITVLFTPTFEAPNADHPDVYLLTDFTVLDQSIAYRAVIGITQPEMRVSGLENDRCKGGLYLYRDGNKLAVYSFSPYSTISAGRSRMIMYFDIDLSTKKFESVYCQTAGWSQVDLTAPIPRVGMADVRLSGDSAENVAIQPYPPQVYDYTGGAARLFHKTDPATGDVQWFIGPTVYPETIWSLFFQDSVPVMINGTMYEVEGGSIDLRDIDPDPRNKKFYIYVTIEGSKPKYILSTLELRTGHSMLHVATVTTNLTQILLIERTQPFMVGDYELSYVRKGGIIPVSSGLPQDDGTFAFLKTSELLP